MSRLVVVRVGDPSGPWSFFKIIGKWASPENQVQAVRNMFNEGYTVNILFVGTGDVPLLCSKVLMVRERTTIDIDMPLRNELGELKTIITFDIAWSNLDLTYIIPEYHDAILEYVKYRPGSQLVVPNNISQNFINYFYNMTNNRTNQTVLNPEYIPHSQIFNMYGC